MIVRLHKASKESGIALMVVLIILMGMAIFGITIYSQSISQAKTAHSQVDQIVASQLAKGAFWKAYNSKKAGDPLNTTTSPVTLNNRTFNVVMTTNPTDSSVDVAVDY